MKYKKWIIIVVIAAIGMLGLILAARHHYSYKSYTAKELGITEITSENDEDNDGIDDYTDLLLGARAYIETKPYYKSVYYKGGYPNDGCGVCTDVIWNAFMAAGYDLKSLVDEDIASDKEAYGITKADPNIDFRRVVNLNVFFQRNAISLTTSLDEPEEWQAGDIVVFKNHIAICSDKRNRDGIPFILHHPNNREGAVEINEMKKYTIIGHYRWEANS